MNEFDPGSTCPCRRTNNGECNRTLHILKSRHGAFESGPRIHQEPVRNDQIYAGQSTGQVVIRHRRTHQRIEDIESRAWVFVI